MRIQFRCAMRDPGGGSFVITSIKTSSQKDQRHASSLTGGGHTQWPDGWQGPDATFLALNVSDAIVVLNPDHKLIYFNPPAMMALEKMLRQKASLPAPDLWLGCDFWDSFPALADSELFETAKLVKVRGEPTKFEACIPSFQTWIEGSICAFAGGVALFFRDSTEAHVLRETEARTKRELKAIASCHQILIKCDDERQLLNEICHVICEQAGYRMAWVGYAHDDDAQSVRPMAWAGFEAGYLSQLNISWADNERGRGPTGSAIRSQANTFCRDFASDPNVAPWREAALRRGYLSSIVLPLKDDEQRTFGALSIYSSQADRFTPDEVHFLERLATELVFGLGVLRARAARQRSADEARETKEAALRELARAHQATLEVHASKSAFLANLTHEIRTPLTAILGYAELIATGAGAASRGAERDRYLEAIERNGRLLSTIINDLLDLAKLDGGRLELNIQNVAVLEIASDMEMLLNTQALAKNIAFHIRCETETPAIIRTDRMRLLQVLLNVVGNAIKFTERGSVTVEIKRLTPLRDHRNGIAFIVTDTGMGMSEADAANLFQPFSQADSSLQRQFGGQGVGLALARRLCEMFGGTVKLTKTALGEGSTFTVALTNCFVHEPQEPVATTFSTPPAEFQLKGVKLLLVDDSPDIQVLIARYLKLAGADVEIAANGKIAVEMAQRCRYDQILMDIQMPVMNGYEAAAALRAMGVEAPIVALTAHASKEERQRCLDCGFTRHLAKPIKSSTLIDTLAELRAHRP